MNDIDSIKFNKDLVRDVVYLWIDKTFGKVKNKEIPKIMKVLVNMSVDTIESKCESEIEKQLGYALYMHLRLAGAYAIALPFQTLRFIEEPEDKHLQVFKEIYSGVQISIYPNAWIDKKTRVDFLLIIKPDRKKKRKLLIIECDSFQYHSTSAQITHEKKRERRIKKSLDGIDILRFSGSEIYKSPFTVAKEITDYIYDKYYGKNKNG